MTKAILFLSAAILGGISGYFASNIASGLQPNYRWVQIFNKTDCEINSARILFPDRTVTVNADQFSSSIYPYGAESAINISILASETQQYQIALDFADCPSRSSQMQKITSGSYIKIWVGSQDIRFGTR